MNHPEAAVVDIDLHREQPDMAVATMPMSPDGAARAISANAGLFGWCRPLGQARPGHGVGPLLGNLERAGGDASRHPLPAEAKPPRDQPRKVARSRTSWFTRGL